ncbi:galanin receptor type 2-like [Orbicella faveolata]|uniref:galanin receptor type 2-like n=1 Tax=Orbicella faveolata TaxID=48498 RepID=UPI0009E52639|nr:galanin receptor type 2-like [Orbicella faveolata]
MSRAFYSRCSLFVKSHEYIIKKVFPAGTAGAFGVTRSTAILGKDMAFSPTDISKAVFLALIFVVSVLGNGLVVYVLTKYRKQLLKNRPTYQFILNIVLSDLVVGLFTIPFEFTRELLDEWIFGIALCKIIEFIEIAVSGTAVCTHALIAFDRYRSLARPYLPKMEGRLVRRMIALSWVVPPMVSLPYLYMFEVQVIDFRMICTPAAIPINWLDKLYEAVEFLVVFFIPFLVLCWCYFHVALIMWGRSPLVVALNFSSAQQSFICQNRRRVTRTSALVAVTFTVCWLPTFVLSFVRIVSGTESVHRGHVLQEIAMFGAFINEAINPIIYCAFDRSLKARIGLQKLCGTNLSDSAGSTNVADPTQNTVTLNVAADQSRKRMEFRKLDVNLEVRRGGHLQQRMTATI